MRGRLAGRLPVGNLLKRRAAAGQLRDRSNRAWKEWRSAVGIGTDSTYQVLVVPARKRPAP
jgi:hypothetical protein